MSMPFARAPHTVGVPGTQVEAPNAALLIDFDNVTMGMRSDLSKELKTLLNSDIIKGKVTVQRAYADWRRYPQYIVPLSENSVDLIFAPAYGSSKKNATDIRMAIDGMELVFIRPEIGTYILLTGDSDFSSLVLKLKEYGKYVIGVGIQESSSDILVQNCDEYYSYTSLTGLRKTTDSANKPVDPWILVEEAVRKMASRNDVMRSDRLKQVMIEIDQSFDEGNFGFSKFSRFLSDAAGRDLVVLRKLENGQYEVHPAGGGKGDGGKGRAAPSRRADPRDRGREEKPASGRGRGLRKVDPRGTVKEDVPTSKEEIPTSGTEGAAESGNQGSGAPLQDAYALLRKALNTLAEGNGGAPVRDSDLKRKMLELESTFNESELGFGKFSRFLRQAHDHEIVDLEKREEGTYQVTLRPSADSGPSGATGGSQESPVVPGAEPPPKVPTGPSGSGQVEIKGLGPRRGERRGSRGKDSPPPLLEGQIVRVPGMSPPAPEEPLKGGVPVAGKPGADARPAGGEVELHQLGLPTGRAAVIRYLTNSYKGVGQKTAESLVEAFGGELFGVLQEEPDKISSVVPGKRAEQLLEGWKVDYQRRAERALRVPEVSGGNAKGVDVGSQEGESEAQPSGDEPDGTTEKKPPPRRRTRQGGRSRSR